MGITRAGRELRRRLAPAPSPLLTQAQLAERLDVTQQAVSAWMRGIALPSGGERRALIESLTGVPAGDWDLADDADESGEHASVSDDSPRSDTG